MLMEYGGGLRGDRVCAEAALVIGGVAAFVLAFDGARSKSCAGSSCATAARTTVSLSCTEATATHRAATRGRMGTRRLLRRSSRL